MKNAIAIIVLRRKLHCIHVYSKPKWKIPQCELRPGSARSVPLDGLRRLANIMRCCNYRVSATHILVHLLAFVSHRHRQTINKTLTNTASLLLIMINNWIECTYANYMRFICTKRCSYPKTIQNCIHKYLQCKCITSIHTFQFSISSEFSAKYKYCWFYANFVFIICFVLNYVPNSNIIYLYKDRLKMVFCIYLFIYLLPCQRERPWVQSAQAKKWVCFNNNLPEQKQTATGKDQMLGTCLNNLV